jgi:hypothetical protein
MGCAVANDIGEGDHPPVASAAEAQQKLENRLFVQAFVAAGAHDLLRYGAICVVSYFGYKSIAALAGQAALADIAIRFFANASLSSVTSWAVGVSGLGYGILQRQLRRRAQKRLAFHDWFDDRQRGRR